MCFRTVLRTVEFVVQGLVVGPLAWDVHLLQLALDGEKVNDVSNRPFFDDMYQKLIK